MDKIPKGADQVVPGLYFHGGEFFRGPVTLSNKGGPSATIPLAKWGEEAAKDPRAILAAGGAVVALGAGVAVAAAVGVGVAWGWNKWQESRGRDE